MSKYVSKAEQARRLRAKVKELAVEDEMRPGEMAAMFIRRMGGKQAFVEALVREFECASSGSVQRVRIVEAVSRDMAAGQAANVGTLDDMDEEALEEIHAGVEKRMAEDATKGRFQIDSNAAATAAEDHAQASGSEPGPDGNAAGDDGDESAAGDAV